MSTRAYDYDAFGVEKSPDPLDENPFRYCGEYYDGETKTYYLRARYYDPTIGRFTQQDTHWTTANSIYGDNPQKINEREDKLGLKAYSYAPQITAIMQSGNLYVYGVDNPVAYVDTTGNFIISTTLLLIISGAVLVGTAGGLIGNSIANQAGATGWSKVGYIAGCAAIGAVVGGAAGWAAAPAVVSATGVAGISVTTAGISTVAATVALDPQWQELFIKCQELICKGWFLPPNTYDCGSFVVNGTAVVGKEPKHLITAENQHKKELILMKSLFEQMGGTYRQEGDYLIPNLALPEESDYQIGKYGRLRRSYLKEHRPVLYANYLMSGTLHRHLAEIDQACNERMEIIISAMAKQEGVTETLKAADQMEWVRRMNNIRSRAEEIVLAELVYE